MKKINWDDQPLGEISDPDLSNILGVSIESVRYNRRKRGIRAHPNRVYKNIDWECQPLGKISDTELSEILECHPSLVARARIKRKIPKFSGPKRRHNCNDTDWDTYHLGDVPDSEIARILGFTRCAVSIARRKRGIKRFQAKCCVCGITISRQYSSENHCCQRCWSYVRNAKKYMPNNQLAILSAKGTYLKNLSAGKIRQRKEEK